MCNQCVFLTAITFLLLFQKVIIKYRDLSLFSMFDNVVFQGNGNYIVQTKKTPFKLWLLSVMQHAFVVPCAWQVYIPTMSFCHDIWTGSVDFGEGREGKRFEGGRMFGGEELITMLLYCLHSKLASSVKERQDAYKSFCLRNWMRGWRDVVI